MYANTPLSFVRGGWYVPKIEYVGSHGFYYYPKLYSAGVAYYMDSPLLYIKYSSSGQIHHGFSLRCVVREEGGGDNKE